jgi:hypothetical protein
MRILGNDPHTSGADSRESIGPADRLAVLPFGEAQAMEKEDPSLRLRRLI